jgi:hypothetical protein
MAERSFAKEVQKLKVGEGETFSGEGILALTKALLEKVLAMSAAIRARRSVI